MRITDMFKRNHFTVREKWECQFRHECEHDPKMKEYFKNNPPSETLVLNLCDTLCGGRTSALRSCKKANLEKGECIKLFDICSEYPFANFKCAYVTGHPAVYLEGDSNMPPVDQWNGAALVQILPPKNLFLPVLGIKCRSKLIFPLCRTCAGTQNQEECLHEDPQDRVLIGSWCAIELQLAYFIFPGGKMGEKTLRPMTELVFDYGHLIQLTQNSAIAINSILPLSEECIQVSYTPKEQMDECFKMTSLIHAAQTTAHGRLFLSFTDSVCFLSVPGQPEPEIGQYLGDMTDQLADDFEEGSYIAEWISAGCKNYGYLVHVRGNPSQIARIPGWRIVTRDTTKTWRVCLNKRRRVSQGRTVPYGYTDTLFDDKDYGLLDVLDSLCDE